jgi:hypothetical protein
MSAIGMIAVGIVLCVAFALDLTHGNRFWVERRVLDAWIVIAFGIFCLIGGLFTLRQR